MCAVQLEVRNISKTYETGLLSRKRTSILKDISFRVEKGQTFGIVGESGTGKTTLGKIIAAVEKPSTGEILFQGNALGEIKKRESLSFRPRIQMMFQDPEGSLNPKKTILKSLDEVLNLIKIPREDRTAAIQNIFATVGLSEEILVRYPNQLSGGQNQRVTLTRILLLDPEIIILDEPTSALDISVQAQMLNLLKDLQQKKGLTYIFISHDIDVIRFMCHDIGVIENGKLLTSAATSAAGSTSSAS
jgi:peptide/nickel transport system ATP-binding protein